MKSKKLLKTTMTITPNTTQLQDSFGKLNAEILGLIQQRHAEYDACMQITAREYFAECVDEFLANFCQAMEDCSMQLSSLARRIKKKLKVTLLHFREYIVRGLWLIQESPKCKEQIEDMYFIPDSFDIDSLKSLIDDIQDSVTLEDSVNDMEHREALRTLRTNMLQSLDAIKQVVDGDKKMQAFTIRRWVARFRADLRELRSVYESRWEQTLEAMKGDSYHDTICQLREDVSAEIESSDFYIEDLNDIDGLVRKIHSLQGTNRGEELDRFLHDYALLEYLDEKLQRHQVRLSTRNFTQNFYGDVNFNAGSTQNGNIISK